MTVNALLGGGSAYAAHRLVDAGGVARWRPMAAGLAVALHPALVPYTAALMTEGVTASLLIMAAALTARARRAGASWLWLVATGCVFGVATLVRPQSFVLAPCFALFAAPATARMNQRIARAAIVTAIAAFCVVPWTARNCIRMGRCAPVSVNEGWNLLIGATTTSGGWQPVTVPIECRTVWDEAAKDTCFRRAAARAIALAPTEWLARAPAKVAMTFDRFGAAPWYLRTSNPAVFSERWEVPLAVIETLVSRALLVAALLACARLPGARPIARWLVSVAGVASALAVHAWPGYLAIVVCVGLSGWRWVVRGPPVAPFAAAVIAATMMTHAAFFGAGRYGLVVAPFVAALAFVERRS
jgi:hypothetical protein